MRMSDIVEPIACPSRMERVSVSDVREENSLDLVDIFRRYWVAAVQSSTETLVEDGETTESLCDSCPYESIFEGLHHERVREQSSDDSGLSNLRVGGA